VTSAIGSPALTAALIFACDRAGLDARGARLIHHYANAVFLLPNEQAVARIAHSGGRARSAQVALDVTRWLVTEHVFPATKPLPGIPAIHVDHDTVTTFWVYYPQPATGAEFSSADLAGLLRRLHELPQPPFQLPEWVPLTSLEATVRSPHHPSAFSSADRDWVLAEMDRVRSGLASLDWPLGLGMIHGDAWAGNLLNDITAEPPRPILCDWDGLALGPREVDLIPTWHAATRYGRGQQWAEIFATTYGYDLGAWPGCSLLMRMRDLMQLTGPLRRASHGTVFEQALRQRLDGLRTGQPAIWTSL
jgi:hypothetical protein